MATNPDSWAEKPLPGRLSLVHSLDPSPAARAQDDRMN